MTLFVGHDLAEGYMNVRSKFDGGKHDHIEERGKEDVLVLV